MDYQIFCKEELRFEELWCKAFAVIWEKYCSRDLQVAIKEMSDFETTVRDNPVELLDRVEKFMHTPERAKYPALTLIEVLLSFLKVRQGDNKELLDYLSRFKSKRDIVMRLFSKRLLDGFTENLPNFPKVGTDGDKKKAKEEEMDKFMVVLFLRNANYD